MMEMFTVQEAKRQIAEIEERVAAFKSLMSGLTDEVDLSPTLKLEEGMKENVMKAVMEALNQPGAVLNMSVSRSVDKRFAGEGCPLVFGPTRFVLTILYESKKR